MVFWWRYEVAGLRFEIDGNIRLLPGLFCPTDVFVRVEQFWCWRSQDDWRGWGRGGVLGDELDTLRGGGVTLVRERLVSLTLSQALVSLLLEILQNISDPSFWLLLPAEENRNFLNVAWLEDWIKQQGGRELGLRCRGQECGSSWTGRGGRGEV